MKTSYIPPQKDQLLRNNGFSHSGNGYLLNELWNQYAKTRDSRMREQLLAKYSYLVRLVLGRMKAALVPHLDQEDLESAGVISLIQALDRFDPHRGIKFETYAYRRIQGGILDHLRQIDYLSRTSRDRIKSLKKAHDHLKERLGRVPTEEELLDEMKISMEDLKKTYFDMSCEVPLSLESQGETDKEDESSWNSEGSRDKKEVEVLDQLIRNETVNHLAEIIESLPEREKLLVSLYYYNDLTFKEIGALFNVSESRICQMHGKALLTIEAGLLEKSGGERA